MQLNWYARNALRSYPLLDGASLPHDMLVDLTVLLPSSITGAVTAQLVTTKTLLSLVLSIDELALAYLSAERSSVSEGAAVPLTPLVDGVVAWAAFGAGVHTHVVNADGTVLPRCIHAGRQAPVTRPNFSGTSVELVAGDGVEILAATEDFDFENEDPDYDNHPKRKRLLDGEYRSCIVVRMKASGADFEQLLTAAGACGGGADGECAGRQPLRTICNVQPACNGNIDIVVTGAPVARLTTPLVGLAIEDLVDFAAACATKTEAYVPIGTVCEITAPDDDPIITPDPPIPPEPGETPNTCTGFTAPFTHEFTQLTTCVTLVGAWSVDACGILSVGSSATWSTLMLHNSATNLATVDTYLELGWTGRAGIMLGKQGSTCVFVTLDAALQKVIVGRSSTADDVLATVTAEIPLPIAAVEPDPEVPGDEGTPEIRQWTHLRTKLYAAGVTTTIEVYINQALACTVTGAPLLRTGRVGLLAKSPVPVLFDGFAQGVSLDLPTHGC